MDSIIMSERCQSFAAEPRVWPRDASLNPSVTALVIIDMQRDFCKEGGYLSLQGYDIGPMRAIIPNIQRLLHVCREKSYPIFHTRQGNRPDLSDLHGRELDRSQQNPNAKGIGDLGPLGRILVRGEAGHDTIPELYPHQGEPVVDKPGTGAFTYTDFDLLLRVKGVKNLILCGVTTDVCVHSTMREANDRGYDCLLVKDACAATYQELHDFAIMSTKAEGGVFGAVSSVRCVIEGIEHGLEAEVYSLEQPN
ncbi:Peroxyureidoacrylate/ureidoacrylate amidohydrolase RutB [Cercospora zeina]